MLTLLYRCCRRSLLQVLHSSVIMHGYRAQLMDGWIIMLSHRNRLFLRHCDGGVELDPTEGKLTPSSMLAYC